MSTQLAISIVLFHPDTGLLDSTVRTLICALEYAHLAGKIGNCTFLLTDHSPKPLREALLLEWHALLGNHIKLDYRHNPDNPGFGSGHNAAFARGGKTADFFLVANPDLEFTEESLAAGLDFFVDHPQIGLLAPALVQEGNQLAPACFRYPDLLTLAWRMVGGNIAAKRSHFYMCRDWDAHSIVFAPPLISGCCMLFRRACFEDLGGFDPGYFLYFEDFDLSWRAGLKNQSAYCPHMQVHHHGGGASRKGLKHVWLYSRSALRFFSRHGWRWY